MTVARSVDDVLTEHVLFQVECIDRMFLNVYVPQLQYPAGLVGYVHRQLGLPIASTAPLARITETFDKAVHRFARDNGLPWVNFVKGQRKDDVAHEYLASFTGSEGVLFVGRAQEKTKLFRTEKRRDANGDSYPWIVAATRFGRLTPTPDHSTPNLTQNSGSAGSSQARRVRWDNVRTLRTTAGHLTHE